MRVIWLRVIPETIEAASQRLSFQCDGGEKAITCSVTAEALDDLVHFHRLDVSKDETFNTLLNEIERIANEKFSAGRVEQNGELVIKTIDVLRYGFQNTGDSAA
jgi:Protein of unknown function (DUF1488)